MKLYTIHNGTMRQVLKDYDYRQVLKYAFWWAVGMGSAHVLEGVSHTPWFGMVLIATAIFAACVWVGRR